MLTQDCIDALKMIEHEGATDRELKEYYSAETFNTLIAGFYIEPTEQVKDLIARAYWNEFEDVNDWFYGLTSFGENALYGKN